MKSHLFTIRRYYSETPAELARMVLEGSGVDARVSTDDCGGMQPFLQASTGVRLIVRSEDMERAEEILKHSEE